MDNIIEYRDGASFSGSSTGWEDKAEAGTGCSYGNLFKYLRSLELAMSGDNLSEPVKIYTNIEGGYGILGTYIIAEKEIQLY